MKALVLASLVLFFIVGCGGGGDGSNDTLPIGEIKGVGNEINNNPTISKVLKTGQTTSYADFDDGYYQIGVERSYTRVNNIVIDNATGLQWQDDEATKTVKKQWVTNANYSMYIKNYSGNNDTSGDTATTYCENLVLGGYSDWRLPTRVELRSIIQYADYKPTINPVFENVAFDYWSSTAARSNYGNRKAWPVRFSNASQYPLYKNISRYVRCVRIVE